MPLYIFTVISPATCITSWEGLQWDHRGWMAGIHEVGWGWMVDIDRMWGKQCGEMEGITTSSICLDSTVLDWTLSLSTPLAPWPLLTSGYHRPSSNVDVGRARFPDEWPCWPLSREESRWGHLRRGSRVRVCWQPQMKENWNKHLNHNSDAKHIKRTFEYMIFFYKPVDFRNLNLLPTDPPCPYSLFFQVKIGCNFNRIVPLLWLILNEGFSNHVTGVLQKYSLLKHYPQACQHRTGHPFFFGSAFREFPFWLISLSSIWVICGECFHWLSSVIRYQ